MPIDLATVVPLVVSVLGALGIASVISQWFAAGKDRRSTRADLLGHLADVEAARWPSGAGEEADALKLRDTLRKLETAALIARIPRRPVLRYAQVATAALAYAQGQAERYGGDPQTASLSAGFHEIALASAEIISRVAWSSSATRWTWLGRRLSQLQRQIDSLPATDGGATLKAVADWVR